MCNASAQFSVSYHAKAEITTEGWLPKRPLVIGITAGASCPNNLFEETIVRLFELQTISRERLQALYGGLSREVCG